MEGKLNRKSRMRQMVNEKSTSKNIILPQQQSL